LDKWVRNITSSGIEEWTLCTYTTTPCVGLLRWVVISKGALTLLCYRSDQE